MYSDSIAPVMIVVIGYRVIWSGDVSRELKLHFDSGTFDAAAWVLAELCFSTQSIILQPSITSPKIETLAMAIPSVEQLRRPEPLHQVIAKDKLDDCLPCRVTGKLTGYQLEIPHLTDCFRRRCLHCPRHVQLSLRTFPIEGTAGEDYEE
jgi:hypothetical protein